MSCSDGLYVGHSAADVWKLRGVRRMNMGAVLKNSLTGQQVPVAISSAPLRGDAVAEFERFGVAEFERFRASTVTGQRPPEGDDDEAKKIKMAEVGMLPVPADAVPVITTHEGLLMASKAHASVMRRYATHVVASWHARRLREAGESSEFTPAQERA